MRLAAKRLLWGKVHNAGQICLSQNYILIDKAIIDDFLSEIRIAMKEFFPNGAKSSPDYGRIVNQRQFNRLKNLIKNTKGKLLEGGTTDEASLFIEPTIIQIDPKSEPLITNETFGPILTLYPISSLTEAITVANQIHSTPLATYSFGTKAETNRVLNEIRSGGASVNDAWVHGTVFTLAFGGVGDSGSGSYRGRASFECFSHRKSYTTSPASAEKLLTIRYPPYKGEWRLIVVSRAREDLLTGTGNRKG